MNLKLKHLTPYLPYGLECHLMGEVEDEDAEPSVPKVFKIVGASIDWAEVQWGKTTTQEWYYEELFPLLRPMSDLTIEIEHEGERFVPYEKLKIPFDMAAHIEDYNYDNLPYRAISQMVEWHFDVFGLIEKGLAIPKEAAVPHQGL
jgi:hypothetical protein